VAVTAVGVLAVQEPIASNYTASPNVVLVPIFIFKIPALTEAVVAVPAYVTLGTVTYCGVSYAAVPGVVVTFDTAVSVTVSCGNVPAFQLVTSSITSVV